MRCLRIEAAQNAADFGQFVHQLALVLQPSCGVDDQDIDAFGGRALYRIEHDACGIAAFGPVTIGTPIRSAQTFNWPMAAARNVSPAASITP
jgi:hypothetical protein